MNHYSIKQGKEEPTNRLLDDENDHVDRNGIMSNHIDYSSDASFYCYDDNEDYEEAVGNTNNVEYDNVNQSSTVKFTDIVKSYEEEEKKEELGGNVVIVDKIPHNNNPEDDVEKSYQIIHKTNEIQAPNNPNGSIGFSFSPGGLLFPYHLGVLSSLNEGGYICSSTPLAGSSAGAIAVVSYACNIDPDFAIESCIKISSKCIAMGGARGNLLPLLEEELNAFLPKDAHEIINRRDGLVGFGYREIFPQMRNILASRFDTREDVIEAVCNSSMMPFFTSNKPFVVRRPKLPKEKKQHNSSGNSNKENEELGEIGDATSACETSTQSSTSSSASSSSCNKEEENVKNFSLFNSVSFPKMQPLPRLYIDGFFSTPRDRFGCPVFPSGHRKTCNLSRTITVSCFPHDAVFLTASNRHDRICPPLNDDDNNNSSTMKIMADLLQKAARPATAQEHLDMYECGKRDGLKWVNEEEKRTAEYKRNCGMGLHGVNMKNGWVDIRRMKRWIGENL
mmetsp:Transcript_7948/g.11581  ORF Transcript_7948/g.11581 Transcript_7948/m.11581 type:complete len:506 (+) Transcript_7948:374-1891(+)